MKLHNQLFLRFPPFPVWHPDQLTCRKEILPNYWSSQRMGVVAAAASTIGGGRRRGAGHGDGVGVHDVGERLVSMLLPWRGGGGDGGGDSTPLPRQLTVLEVMEVVMVSESESVLGHVATLNREGPVNSAINQTEATCHSVHGTSCSVYVQLLPCGLFSGLHEAKLLE